MDSINNHRYTGVLLAVRVMAVDLVGLEDIVRLINDFLLDESRWSIEQACLHGFPRLARYLMECGIGPRAHPSYVAHLCNKGIAKAAASGNLATIIDFDRCFPTLVFTHAVASAAQGGHTNVLDWLRARGRLVIWPRAAFARASLHGQVDAVRWLRRHGGADNKNPELLCAVVAAKLDEVTKMLWPLFASRSRNASGLSAAMSSAPLHMAQWMLPKCSFDVKLSIDKPAARGDIQFLQWAQGHNATATTHAMDEAAGGGHLDVVIWLHKTRSEGCTRSAMNLASCRGHFEVIKWLTAHRQEGCSGEALFGAATTGRLDILQWLLKYWPSVACPPSTFDHVCARGYLDVAQFLTANGIGGGSHNAIDWAAGNNHVQILEYLQEARTEGCTTGAMNSAAGNGSFEALKWLAQHRQEGCTTTAMDLAVYNGHKHIVLWLRLHRREGCSTRAIMLAARRGNVDMMRWLEETYPDRSSARCIDAAIDSGKLTCVQWCREHRQEYASADGVYMAVRRGFFSIVEYLRMSGSSACATEAFECAVESKQLYLSSWIADNFPHTMDRSFLESLCPANGWNDSIIDEVFGDKMRYIC